jgi:hypothetical protein
VQIGGSRDKNGGGSGALVVKVVVEVAVEVAVVAVMI